MAGRRRKEWLLGSRVSGCRIMFGKRVWKGVGGGKYLLCCRGSLWRPMQREINGSTIDFRVKCGATGARKWHPQRELMRDVQARRKDADACCRMTTRLRVRRMKAVPTRLFTSIHVHRDSRLV
jgi:hypothetical protein